MIGFLGGTFDPIHNGHLRAAAAAAAVLDLDCVNLVLAARPNHRAEPRATIEQRWTMLELATRDNPLLNADDREIRRGTASYTIDSLVELRAQHGASKPIVWLLGWDAYRDLSSWHRWRELIQLAHLAVLRRPGADGDLDAVMRHFTAAHRTDEAAMLRRRPGGHVCFIDAPMLPISSSDIRARLARGDDIRQLLPSAVWTYIKSQRLYAGPSTE